MEASNQQSSSIMANQKQSVGNMAVMLEAVEIALTTIRGVINGTIARTNNSVFDCRDKLKAALSAPPRQCDFGTADDQAKRFKAFCRDRQCGSCYGCPIPKKGFCTLQWAQMPYDEEGGAK